MGQKAAYNVGVIGCVDKKRKLSAQEGQSCKGRQIVRELLRTITKLTIQRGPERQLATGQTRSYAAVNFQVVDGQGQGLASWSSNDNWVAGHKDLEGIPTGQR